MDVVSAASVELAGRTSADVDRSPVEVEQALVQRLEQDPDFFVRSGALRLTRGGRRVRVGVRRDVRERLFPSVSIRIFPLSSGGAHVTWNLRGEAHNLDSIPFARWRWISIGVALMGLASFGFAVTAVPERADWTDILRPALPLSLAIECGYFATRRRPMSVGLEASEAARIHDALHAAITGADAPGGEPGHLSLAEPSAAGELSLSDARP